MKRILRYLHRRAALKRAAENHRNALQAASDIKAARRKLRTARHHTRARLLYAAWLDPQNPGWPSRPQQKPANVISIRSTGDIQFPRIAETLSGLSFSRKGGAM